MAHGFLLTGLRSTTARVGGLDSIEPVRVRVQPLHRKAATRDCQSFSPAIHRSFVPLPSYTWRIVLPLRIMQGSNPLGVRRMSYANLGQILRLQAARLGPRPALRYRKYGLYRDLTWDYYLAQVQAAAMALVDAGVAVGDRAGLVGENSASRLTADMAILTAGAVNVSPPAPLTARQIQYQLHDSGCVWAITSSRGQLDKLRSLRAEMPALRGIVVFDDAAAADDAVAWDAFVQHGR